MSSLFQLKNLAENKPLMEDLGLEEKLGKLNINQARVRVRNKQATKNILKTSNPGFINNFFYE